MSNAPDESGILRRRMTPWQPRRTYFSKALVWADERGVEPAPLSSILDYVASRGYRQILLTGGWNAAHTPERDYWLEPTANGWAVERYVPDPRSAVFYRAGSGDRVTVRMSAAWYDDCADTPLIEMAHSRLEHLVKDAFDKDAILFGTPSRTGEDLLLRSLPQREIVDMRGQKQKQAYEYLPAPAAVRDILAHNFGQGRMEFIAPEGASVLNDLYLLDARWMYAAHCRGLPVLLEFGAQLVFDDAPDFEDYRPGFYRVLFRAPEGWPHIGLLPAWNDEEHRTSWPVDSYFWQAGWATEPEVRLARRQGWDVRIRERILFAPDSTPGSDPARKWIETLVKLRTQLQAENSPENRLLVAALRNIQVGTVGSWKRATRRELHVTLPGAEREIPDDADDVAPIYADPAKPTPDSLQRIEWYSRGKLDTMQAALYRPEWSINVWGSARKALAEESLKYPRDWEIALRSDAIALRCHPLMSNLGMTADDGKPGRFRLKKEWHFETPQAVPHDETSWRALTGGEE